MANGNFGTYYSNDVNVLLTDVSTEIGTRANELLASEYVPSSEYIRIFDETLKKFASPTALAIMRVAEGIYKLKGNKCVLCSLTRAGTPIGILIKRYLDKKYAINIPHYTIAATDGRIDQVAMKYLLGSYEYQDLQFVDAWTGTGTRLSELRDATSTYFPTKDIRQLLAVVVDATNITDLYGTRDDIPLANSFLEALTSGLMSAPILRHDADEREFFGTIYFPQLTEYDKTYTFIEQIEKHFDFKMNEFPPSVVHFEGYNGFDEIAQIMNDFNIDKRRYVRPGIGETARLLLRRPTQLVLVRDNLDTCYVNNILYLANEHSVPITRYPLKVYNACAIRQYK